MRMGRREANIERARKSTRVRKKVRKRGDGKGKGGRGERGS